MCWFTNRPKCEHSLEQSYSGMYSIFQHHVRLLVKWLQCESLAVPPACTRNPAGIVILSTYAFYPPQTHLQLTQLHLPTTVAQNLPK